MYLRTPKRYTAKGSRRPLLNLRWLWLYILVPICLIPAVLVWDFRNEIRPYIEQLIPTFQINAPTPTATVPPAQFPPLFADAVQSGHIDKALQILRDWSDSEPNNIAIHALLAQWIILRAYGTDTPQATLDAAYQAGQSAINANPENATGWVTQALVLDWSSRPQEALPYALRAKDLDDKSPMVTSILAEIYLDLQKYDEASALVDQAIKQAKDSNPLDRMALSHAYYVKGKILADTSQPGKDAVDAYKEALRVATSDPPDLKIPIGYITFPLGVAYMNADETQLGIEILGKAIQRDVDDPLLPYLLGRLYYKDGETEKAKTYWDTCHDLDPNQPKCLRYLGLWFMSKSVWTQAAQMYQQLIDNGSQTPGDYLFAAQAYSNQNHCDTAIGILQRGLTFVGADDQQTRANFEDALRACGSTAGISLDTPIPDGTADATAAANGQSIIPK